MSRNRTEKGPVNAECTLNTLEDNQYESSPGQNASTVNAGLAVASRRSDSVAAWMSRWSIPAWIQAMTTVALVFITFSYVRLTHDLVRLSMHPEVVLEFSHTDGKRELVISNDGLDPVVDVSINTEKVIYVGNIPSIRVTPGRSIPGRTPTDWWTMSRLSPNQVQVRAIDDIGESVANGIEMVEAAKSRGELRDVSPKEKVPVYGIVTFRMTYKREVDRKRYTADTRVLVLRDSQTRKPAIFGEAHIRPWMGLDNTGTGKR